MGNIQAGNPTQRRRSSPRPNDSGRALCRGRHQYGNRCARNSRPGHHTPHPPSRGGRRVPSRHDRYAGLIALSRTGGSFAPSRRGPPGPGGPPRGAGGRLPALSTVVWTSIRRAPVPGPGAPSASRVAGAQVRPPGVGAVERPFGCCVPVARPARFCRGPHRVGDHAPRRMCRAGQDDLSTYGELHGGAPPHDCWREHRPAGRARCLPAPRHRCPVRPPRVPERVVDTADLDRSPAQVSNHRPRGTSGTASGLRLRSEPPRPRRPGRPGPVSRDARYHIVFRTVEAEWLSS
ncbi:hypothetical protein CLV40_116119 [Actinokineospora auranticolor]|uniref:Uncharacterized protein n=1 Tax=Actinokineospora auranticolor TaxID=155976 RepID=A0A2S6GIU7_9PSEU|nr:hypothetical protein CLV40_116119 [Actinokineospora auranticolor]